MPRVNRQLLSAIDAVISAMRLDEQTDKSGFSDSSEQRLLVAIERARDAYIESFIDHRLSEEQKP
jgi:hypothetical protein